MDIRSFFISNPQPSVLMQPADCALNHPTIFSKTAAIGCAPFWDDRFNSTIPKKDSMRHGIISPVGVQLLRYRQWPAGLTFDGRNCLNQAHELGYVVPVCSRESNGKRNAPRIRDDVVFRAFFAPIRWVRPGFGPPKTALTEPLSTTTREKSILPAERSRSKRTLCTLLHTPASCQSRSRRQQVIPDPQPISLGRYSQGIPVLSTNKMPVKTTRSSKGGRPPTGFGGLFGKRGSIKAHNSSVSIGLAMTPSSLTDGWLVNSPNYIPPEPTGPGFC